MSTLKRKLGFIALGAMMALPICSQGQSVAILKGSFYSPNLKNALSAAGANVTEISTDYTAASLASYESVIVYGNLNYTHMSELADYASAGGTLIETPWFWTNYTPDSAIDIFSHGGIPKFAETFPGVSVLSPANPLLDGVTFPGGGRIQYRQDTGQLVRPERHSGRELVGWNSVYRGEIPRERSHSRYQSAGYHKRRHTGNYRSIVGDSTLLECDASQFGHSDDSGAGSLRDPCGIWRDRSRSLSEKIATKQKTRLMPCGRFFPPCEPGQNFPHSDRRALFEE